VALIDSDKEGEISAAVRAVRTGDVQAYATIVRRFQASIMTLCVAILRDRQAAEELAQDVFVQAYHRLDTFDLRRPMKPWLVTIAHRLALQRWRQRAREAGRLDAVAKLERGQGDPESAVRLQVDEQAQFLWQAVHELPLGERTAVVLYYRESMTVQEVARAMSVSPGTVKTHLFRARAKIQVKLRDKGFDEGDLS